MAKWQRVIIDRPGKALMDALLREAWRTALPDRVMQAIVPRYGAADDHPERYKEQLDGRASPYVCVGAFCPPPLTEPADFADAILFVRRTVKAELAGRPDK